MKKYLIISSSEVSKINFNEILETSKNTLRYSIDGTKTFINWNTDEIPSFVSNFETAEGPYNYEEIIKILSANAWTTPLKMPLKNENITYNRGDFGI